jgi:hypothetical protein
MLRQIPILLLLSALLAAQQSAPKKVAPARTLADSVSGMYTFLQEGEFVQLNVENEGPRPIVGDRAAVPTPASANHGTGDAARPPVTAPGLDLTVGDFSKPRAVTGFVSRFGDSESDKGTFLDHFITKGALYGDELTFTTKPLHGVWFEFKGKLERGAAKTRAEEGYYVLRGTLKRLSTDANKKTTSQSREATFKSFPDLDAANPTD